MSSACYVYAIVRRGTRLAATGTCSTAELAMVSWRELSAVTTRTTAHTAPVTVEAVLRHEAVVEAVRQQGPALPVRFGTVFSDASLVASALAERYEPLAADLDRLGDKVELSLTALWASPGLSDNSAVRERDDTAPVMRSAGASYIHARADEVRRDDAQKEWARRLAEQLDEVLGGRSIERRVSLVPRPRVAVRTAYLMDPAGVRAFRSAFDVLRRSLPDVRLLLTGPWPPYSFVRRTETAAQPAPLSI